MSVLCVKRKIPIRDCGKNCDVMEIDIAVLLNIKGGREGGREGGNQIASAVRQTSSPICNLFYRSTFNKITYCINLHSSTSISNACQFLKDTI
jgi:hypothetical protein